MDLTQGSGGGLKRSVSARVEPGSHPGTWTVTFESQAVPGTLAVFAGTLALTGLDIISAMVRTSPGAVTDIFDVMPLGGTALDRIDAERLSQHATEALEGRRDLAGELRTLRRSSGERAGQAPRVETTTDSSLTTGINVVAPDRAGLLYDIASTLTAHGLRTRSLSALTFNGHAHDTFRVVDALGKPPQELLVLSRLQAALVRACS